LNNYTDCADIISNYLISFKGGK